jgi:membrane-anchored protein YejM (alkaline phosphatase superfamily)
MVLEQNLSLVNKVNRLLNWGHWFTFFNILLALLITAAYWWAEPLPQTVTGWFYLVSNWLGHTAFLCFLFFILTIFPVTLIFPYQRHVRGIAAALATVGLVALIFDAYVYQALGYHVGSASSEQTFDLLRQQVVTNLRNFILITSVVSAVLLAIELVLSNYCWKKVTRLQASGVGQPALYVFLGCFVASHSLHIWADAQLDLDVMKQDNVLPFTYPATANTFLAKYKVLDLSRLQESKAEQLQRPDNWLQPDVLQCRVVQTTQPVKVLILPSLSASDISLLQQHRFKAQTQHFAPVDAQSALLNLIYGRMQQNQQTGSSLQQPPGWLQQLTAEQFSISTSSADIQRTLPWVSSTEHPAATVQIKFIQDLATELTELNKSTRTLVLTQHAPESKFDLAPALLYSNWPGLNRAIANTVTQHLDLLPTVLAQIGCYSNWPGDNWFNPSVYPKLNILPHQMVSFKKDKMILVRDDGSYGVWSAGTLVPLSEKLDLPQLTDALKRLQLQPQ